MLRHRRHVSGALAAVAIAAVVAACGSTPSEGGKATITFSWWGDASRAKSTEAAVRLFEKQHPDITVKTWYSAFGDYEKKVATLTAGGNMPDLMTVDIGIQNEYAQRGLFADLGKYTPSPVNLGGIDPKLVNTGKSGGTQFAVPMAQNSQAIVVDVTRLKSLGMSLPPAKWTWDDLKSWAQQITTRSHGKYYGFVDPGTLWPAFKSWLIQHGKYPYQNNKINFTEADIAGFWTMTSGLRTSKAATDAHLTATVDGLPADEPLLKGKAVAEWDYDSLFTMYSAGTKDELALVPLPAVNGQTGMFGQPSMMLAVASKSRHPRQAAELMNFLINSPQAATTLGTSRGLFPNLAVRRTQASSATGPTKTIYDYEASVQSGLVAAPAAPPKGDGELLTQMQTVYQQVAFGQLSVAAGAKRFMTFAQQTIGQ